LPVPATRFGRFLGTVQARAGARVAPVLKDGRQTPHAAFFSRAAVGGLFARPPAIAWTLSLLFLLKWLMSLATVAFPLSSKEPVTLLAFAGTVALVCAIAIWLLGALIPRLVFVLLAAGASLAISGLIARAATHGGVMMAAFSYPWIAIYSAHFFSRRTVIAQGLVISVGSGVGLLIGGLPNVVPYWLMINATTWSICLLLGDLSESMRRLAGTDHLTGLLNRNGFEAAALRERMLADRSGNPLTIAVIDLDGFKQVNDRDGHAAGDRLLRDLARGWRARIRHGDILARHGGDEFVLLLPDTTPGGAHTMLERLHSGEDALGWSAGVSEWRSGEPLASPLARADRYLYRVKSAQRGKAAVVRDVRGAEDSPGVADIADAIADIAAGAAQGGLLRQQTPTSV
jgi:diguanylate cyclase (GGDEF)-like protein